MKVKLDTVFGTGQLTTTVYKKLSKEERAENGGAKRMKMKVHAKTVY